MQADSNEGGLRSQIDTEQSKFCVTFCKNKRGANTLFRFLNSRYHGWLILKGLLSNLTSFSLDAQSLSGRFMHTWHGNTTLIDTTVVAVWFGPT